ncbi:hypothetical protein RN001_016316 [Aquatica leii]|uniref:Uncharacterized protein n=1 Tax=Aquatica leii TaxID=1421715 RepID=A0AAN7SBB6_9COLE|nr:hypothetical protein RN001_016316 [Aquatica leii]
MDPKTFYGRKEHTRLEHAVEDIISQEFNEDEDLEICILPPPVDELTDTEEFDDDISLNVDDIPVDIPGSVEISKPQVTCGVERTTDGIALQVKIGAGAKLELLEPPFEVTFENTGSKIEVDFAKVKNTSIFKAPIVKQTELLLSDPEHSQSDFSSDSEDLYQLESDQSSLSENMSNNCRQYELCENVINTFDEVFENVYEADYDKEFEEFFQERLEIDAMFLKLKLKVIAYCNDNPQSGSPPIYPNGLKLPPVNFPGKYEEKRLTPQ